MLQSKKVSDSRALEGVVANEGKLLKLAERLKVVEHSVLTLEELVGKCEQRITDVCTGIYQRIDHTDAKLSDVIETHKTNDKSVRIRLETWGEALQPKIHGVEREISALQSMMMRQIASLEKEFADHKARQQSALQTLL